MTEFSPEFHGMVAALWATYEPAILIWFGMMFSAVVLLAAGIILWNIIRPIFNR